MERPQKVEPLVVLAVDDDALVLTNTAAMLEDMGHHVLQAPSGREALAILAEKKVDLVVTDYAMPDMNGVQLVAALPAGQRVLIVSGFAEIPIDSGSTGPRLTKPFRDAQLTAAIRQVMQPRGDTVAP